ncbi:MAG: hypothetical protein U0794_09550 [Isosphaeraceae bacterium]
MSNRPGRITGSRGAMAACDTCGTTILFGGIENDGFRYCGEKCAEQGKTLHSNCGMTDEEIEQSAREIHQGNCPKCGGPGPVDVHTSHKVHSFLVFTSWSSKPEICCRGCGTKSKLLMTLYSGAAGWWGFPWGLIMTPIQVAKNLGGAVGMGLPDPSTPSPELKRAVKLIANARRTAAIQAAAENAAKFPR